MAVAASGGSDRSGRGGQTDQDGSGRVGQRDFEEEDGGRGEEQKVGKDREPSNAVCDKKREERE